MENRVETSSNQFRAGKFEEKNRFDGIIKQYYILVVPWQHFFSISALKINVHSTNFFESRGLEEDHNLFESNFINRISFIEISEKLY